MTQMQKRIVTEEYVLEFKNPEKVKGLAIGIALKDGENEAKTLGGVVGSPKMCVESIKSALTALATQMLNDEVPVSKVIELIATMTFEALQRAKHGDYDNVSEQVQNGSDLN